MTSPFDHSVECWLSCLEDRMASFSRDDLFWITKTPQREWWAELLENEPTTATLIRKLISETKQNANGCLEASAGRPRRVTVKYKQTYAYQLIYWCGNGLIPSDQDVVRHKCHNRRCINPHHLTHGTQMENINDTRDR